MASETTADIPPIPVVQPNGTCFCGCGEAAAVGKFFIVTMIGALRLV